VPPSGHPRDTLRSVRRLRPIDLALITTFGPLWVLCITLHAVQATQGRIAWMPLQAASGPAGYPVARGLIAGTETERLSFLQGDTILRLGTRDMAGVGGASFTAAAWSQVDEELGLRVGWQRGGQASGVDYLRLKPVPFPLRTLPLIAIAGILALLGLLRGRGHALVRAWSLAGFAHSLQWATFFGPVEWQSTVSLWVSLTAAALVWPLTLRALIRTPETSLPRSAAGQHWPWLFLGFATPALTSWLLGWPFPSEAGLAAIFALNLASVAAALVVITRNYIASNAAGRRKLKWVVYGLYVGLVPVFVGAGIASTDSGMTWAHEIGAAFTVLIPICIYAAIVRDDFLDIDRLITETAAYSLATLGLLGVLVQALPAAAGLVSSWTGIEVDASQALVFAGIAAIAVPVRGWLSPYIQATFFRRRTAVEQGLQKLREDLARTTEPGKLFEQLGEALVRLLQPEGCVIYARNGDSFTPVFAQGAVAPPAFEGNGPLVGLLEDHAEPVDAVRWRRWIQRGLLRDQPAEAIGALDPALILPIQVEEQLAAFVTLGPQHSGDIYTPSEVAWLTAATERAAGQLQHATDTNLLERSRELQSKLARYVPGAIATQLTDGEELEPRTREVSVLFVDIRGYTGFSESREAADIFSAVSQYTQTVSGIVLSHGGAVVEFHGDGVMVVFGAPKEIPSKERAAVAAAREIVEAVPRLQVDGATLEVGVGIATGEAFVGNIESVDRVIWGALGNTTNLAARLQAMSRELGASIVLDGLTRARSQAVSHGFEDRGELPIRGRSDAEQIYALPLRLAGTRPIPIPSGVAD
jgi:class 3 adenylate cyclase